MLMLASASPRRHHLLTEWGVPHRVVPSRLSEPAPRPTDTPVRYARRLALAKALAVARGVRCRGWLPPGCVLNPVGSHPRHLTPRAIWVLGADTIVVVGRHILGKPRDQADAERMLRALSGTTHRVITAVALVCGAGPRRWLPTGLSKRPGGGHLRGPASSAVSCVAHAVSRVTMRRLTPAEIHRYARRHRDKAGSYAIQETGDGVIEKIEGSYTNVVGLPKEIVLPLLRRIP